ncbi:proton-conducting transporter transmembrane domain-containing protein, partial [Nocardiopsis salina]|uniref:proton-conducting transporter transmembrane domain-containing protein n=1 Tax=Nocardiopsis salina TaxID=245836 RepID=UPI000369B012
MNTALLPMFAGLPLAMAGLLAVVTPRGWLRTTLFLSPGALGLAASSYLLWLTRGGEVFSHNVALWDDGIAIPFVADAFSALMIWTSSLLVVVCSWFAATTGDHMKPYFPALVLVLYAGVVGAVLTGDLFNLFVFIEVMLIPSYGLLAMVGALGRLRAGRIFVTVNLLTSTIFLMGVALVYGAAGTVHVGELAGAAAE